MSALKRIQLQNKIRWCRDDRLKKLYESQLAEAQKPLTQAQLLAIDLEMTGLNAQQDHILSVGWVPIKDGKINLRGARHCLIQSSRDVGDSATIHGIKDSDKAGGQALAQVMAELLDASHNHVLIFHHAKLDLAFLDKALRSSALTKPLKSAFKPLTIDTMRLEHAKLTRHSEVIAHGALRLGACRTRYHLPDYSGHNALSDALSTAELLLAICSNKRQQRLLEWIN